MVGAAWCLWCSPSSPRGWDTDPRLAPRFPLQRSVIYVGTIVVACRPRRDDYPSEAARHQRRPSWRPLRVRCELWRFFRLIGRLYVTPVEVRWRRHHGRGWGARHDGPGGPRGGVDAAQFGGAAHQEERTVHVGVDGARGGAEPEVRPVTRAAASVLLGSESRRARTDRPRARSAVGEPVEADRGAGLREVRGCALGSEPAAPVHARGARVPTTPRRARAGVDARTRGACPWKGRCEPGASVRLGPVSCEAEATRDDLAARSDGGKRSERARAYVEGPRERAPGERLHGTEGGTTDLRVVGGHRTSRSS